MTKSTTKRDLEELPIIRGYPAYYSIIDITEKLHARWNFTPDNSPTYFDIYYEFTQHADFHKFCLWAFEKINPDTNRKLSEHGLVYKNIGYNTKYQNLSWNFLKTIDTTDREKYRQDTDDIIEEYKAEVEKKKNRNNQILEIRKQICNLSKWDEFVIFENTRYGCQKFHNNTHYHNNCLGHRTFNTTSLYYTDYEYPYICDKCGEIWRENYDKKLWSMNH